MWEERDINFRSEAPLTSLPGAFSFHQCRREDHRMRMYFLTTTALSGINLRHLVTTEGEHCLCVATVLSVRKDIFGGRLDVDGIFVHACVRWLA